jgi:hypothetical protein
MTYTDSGTKKRMDTTRHAGLLSKPFREDGLMDLIRNVIDGSAENRRVSATSFPRKVGKKGEGDIRHHPHYQAERTDPFVV